MKAGDGQIRPYTKLTTRQELFCQAYVNGGAEGVRGSQVAAYLHAYPGVKNRATADTSASYLLTISKIQEYIAQLKEENQRRHGVSLEKQLKRLEQIASVDISMFVKSISANKAGVALIDYVPIEEWTPAMKMACEGIRINSKGQMEIRLQGKSWAFDMIHKHLGIYEKDNKQKDGAVVLNLPGAEPIVFDNLSKKMTDDAVAGE